MEKLVCSLCGYEGGQKRFKFKNINEHFDKAQEVWCPRNCCKEKYSRVVPDGYVCNMWLDYGGWYTLERRSNIIDFEEIKSIQRARAIRDIGLAQLKENRPNHNNPNE